MGSHPINLGIRFLLEIIALFSLGLWGWSQSDEWYKFLLAIGIPAILAAIWGIFAVPDDPSRSGKAPVRTPGIIRLIFELAFFAAAFLALLDMDFNTISWIFGISVIIHYILSYDRIGWLLSK